MKIQAQLIIVFIVILILFGIQSWVFLQRSNSALLETINKESLFYAENRINQIDLFLADKLEELRLFTYIYEVQTALHKSNREFANLENITALLTAQDEAWPRPGTITPFVDTLLQSPLSQQIENTLIRFGGEQYASEIYSEIFVTNKYGAIVGLSNVTSDYNQADEEWWTTTRDSGIYVSDLSFDESADLYSISLNVSITDKQGNFTGVIKAVLSLRTIVAHTFLARGLYDSTIVELLDKEQRVLYSNINYKIFEDHSDLYILDVDDGHSKAFVSDLFADEQLVILAKSVGAGEYTGLGWTFMVRHDTEEVLNPLASLFEFASIMFSVIVGIILITGAYILWFVFRLQKKVRVATKKISDLAKFPAENPNPIMRVARDYTLLYANETSRWVLKQWRISTGQKLPDGISELIEKKLQTKTVAEIEFVVRDTSYTCLFYCPGNREYVNLYLRDITKEKSVDREKTEFVSLASHQLRTPLSIINWHSEMLDDPTVGKLNKKQKEYVHEVREGSLRMTELVGALLNVTRLDLGTYKIEPQSIDLKTLLEALEKQYVTQTTEKQIVFKIKVASKVQTINADPTITRLILDNLISNAN